MPLTKQFSRLASPPCTEQVLTWRSEAGAGYFATFYNSTSDRKASQRKGLKMSKPSSALVGIAPQQFIHVLDKVGSASDVQSSSNHKILGRADVYVCVVFHNVLPLSLF